ncbi:hypothetical protein HU200_005710 [Digitaria exilis]|uniref:peptide-methionine (S)-S-oxide reductase n=1 Tax=Digitaria exilis TaxID=1010633 RepID=A0A835FTI6_9POAL|nr:hypothetical protein HU200_005710 [Digitaria exilis]
MQHPKIQAQRDQLQRYNCHVELPCWHTDGAAANPALEPDTDAAATGEGLEVAQFAAGCFWSVELTYQRLPGVARTEVGYSQGHLDEPTYELVCAHGTGHAEVVRVHYDPEAVPYAALLEVFWNKIDPRRSTDRYVPSIYATPNSIQFCGMEWTPMIDHESITDDIVRKDVGTQYRTGIYYYTAEQERQARDSLVEEQNKWEDPSSPRSCRRGGSTPPRSTHQLIPREGWTVRREGLHRPHAMLRLKPPPARRSSAPLASPGEVWVVSAVRGKACRCVTVCLCQCALLHFAVCFM